MRKIVVTEFVTLDGVMQGPGSPDEDREGGFDQGGWQLQFPFDETQMKDTREAMASTDAYLLGRKTYEIFARYWPQQPDTDMFAAVLNPRPKYVVSRTLHEPLEWQNSTLISDDVAAAIARLKDRPGKSISVLGSGDLVQTLLRHDLVDELVLMIHPLVLGEGKRLFRDGLPPKHFELAASTPPSASGVVTTTYRPAA